MCLSRNSVASNQNYTKKTTNRDWAEINCLSSKIFEDKSIFRLSWNSISSHRSCSKTFPNCVWAKSQVHLIEFNLRQYRIVSKLESQCISSNLFYDSFKFCPSLISNASYRKQSKTIPNCVWAEIQLHLIDFILQHFHNAS